MKLWNRLDEFSKTVELLLNSHLLQVDKSSSVSRPGWNDHFWNSPTFRYAHMNVNDLRDTHKLWLMHINIFPSNDLNLPILGFDIVAGENKITGCFFDFSPIGPKHPYTDYFEASVSGLEWNKPRDLPEWALPIFSENMIAAGNIRSEQELNQLIEVCTNLINYYLNNSNVFELSFGSYKEEQNLYCRQQKLNPHLHKSLISIGLTPDEKQIYIDSILFPEQ